jgi:hypothetical protein
MSKYIGRGQSVIANQAYSKTETDDLIDAIPEATPTQVSGQDNSSTAYFDLPSGTAAQRPLSPNSGYLRFNTDVDALEQYTSIGWQTIAAPPIITSISPLSVNESDTTQTITIAGTNFDTGAVGTLLDGNGQTVAPTTSTRNSASQITLTLTGSDRLTASTPEPLDVRVLNGSGLSSTLADALEVNASPVWTQAENTTLQTVYENPNGMTYIDYGNYQNYTITATSETNGTKESFFSQAAGATAGWAPAQTTTLHEWVIDLGSSVVVKRFNFFVNDGQGGNTSTELLGSNDNSAYTQIQDLGLIYNRTYNAFNNLDTNTTAYRYLKFRRQWSYANYGRHNGLQISYETPASELTGSTANATATATDPEGGTVTYTSTGSLPTGLTLSGNAITGSLDAGNADYNTSGVVHNVTMTASDGTNTKSRVFNIVRKWFDGSTSGAAAQNATDIKNLINATSADDGDYWIKPIGRSPILMPCEFNSVGGWMLIVSSNSYVPDSTSAEGTVGIGSYGKFADADINAIDWTYMWIGATVDMNNYTMDNNRQLFSAQGRKFPIVWGRYYTGWQSGDVGNGRNMLWRYNSPTGTLSGSSRQPSGTIDNGAGNQSSTLGNTNTYSVAPHEAGGGGMWVHSSTAANYDNYFSTGFGSDYSPARSTTKHFYWFVR